MKKWKKSVLLFHFRRKWRGRMNQTVLNMGISWSHQLVHSEVLNTHHHHKLSYSRIPQNSNTSSSKNSSINPTENCNKISSKNSSINFYENAAYHTTFHKIGENWRADWIRSWDEVFEVSLDVRNSKGKRALKLCLKTRLKRLSVSKAVQLIAVGQLISRKCKKLDS